MNFLQKKKPVKLKYTTQASRIALIALLVILFIGLFAETALAQICTITPLVQGTKISLFVGTPYYVTISGCTSGCTADTNFFIYYNGSLYNGQNASAENTTPTVACPQPCGKMISSTKIGLGDNYSIEVDSRAGNGTLFECSAPIESFVYTAPEDFYALSLNNVNSIYDQSIQTSITPQIIIDRIGNTSAGQDLPDMQLNYYLKELQTQAILIDFDETINYEPSKAQYVQNGQTIYILTLPKGIYAVGATISQGYGETILSNNQIEKIITLTGPKEPINIQETHPLAIIGLILAIITIIAKKTAKKH